MPHLLRIYGPEPFVPAGSPPGTPLAVLSSQQVLQNRGPLVTVTVALPVAIAEEISNKGGTPPAPQQGLALIDTGATGSAICAEVAAKMALPIIDRVKVMTPSDDEHECNRHPVRVAVSGSSWQFDVIATGSKLQKQGLLMLLGRDALKRVQLVYNGEFGMFTIAY